MKSIVEYLNDMMTSGLGLSLKVADIIDGASSVLLLLLVCFGMNWLCQSMYRWIASRNKRIQSSKWFKYGEENKLSRNIILVIPGIFFYIGVWLLFEKGDQSIVDLHRYCIVYFVVVAVLVVNSILKTFLSIYSRTERNRKHPLKGLVQGLQVIVYFIGVILIISLIINKSPAVLLTGLGASAAILMLIFKDSILGLVAGIQLSRNNMLRIGDWIQTPDGNANGIVEEITLNTIKVRNWDNTLTMVPPYTLVSSPFRNWRGMQESSGRRVDKCVYVDINSIKNFSREKLEQMKSSPLLKFCIDPDRDVTKTNIQLYREYIECFLRENPEVNPSLDLIVTQKEQTEYGVPIEIYFFLKDKAWSSYEKKQSDIFAHLISIAPQFEIRLYQRP